MSLAEDLRTPAAAAVTLAAVLTLIAPTVDAEIVAQGAGGFTVRAEARIAAPPAEIWEILTGEIGVWWHPDHTYSGDSARLSLDPTPGGCFCEELPSGGGVQHLQVVYADGPRTLRLSGGLGPLQEIGASGALTWSLQEEEASGETRVTYSYAVHGHLESGLGAWAAPVDGVLGQQLERLQRLIETGSPRSATEP